MKLFVRNIQFLTVVLLQIMTIAILIVLLPQHTHNSMIADAIRDDPCGLPKRELIRLEDIRTVITADEKKDELYGLSKEDAKRINDIYNNGESEIIKRNLGHFKIEDNPKSRDFVFTKKDVYFANEKKDVIILSLEEYDDRQGVINSPDKTLKGLPYEVGVVWYGFQQPYVFTRSNKVSQAVLIPYTVGGGTGVAESNWCLAASISKTVFVKQMGLSHYHCYGPEENFFSFDIISVRL